MGIWSWIISPEEKINAAVAGEVGFEEREGRGYIICKPMASPVAIDSLRKSVGRDMCTFCPSWSWMLYEAQRGRQGVPSSPDNAGVSVGRRPDPS